MRRLKVTISVACTLMLFGAPSVFAQDLKPKIASYIYGSAICLIDGMEVKKEFKESDYESLDAVCNPHQILAVELQEEAIGKTTKQLLKEQPEGGENTPK